MTNNTTQKREAIVDDVNAILRELEEITGQEFPSIQANLSRARDQLQNDEEFNYNVRLALAQIAQQVESSLGQSSHDRFTQRVNSLTESLEARADLPPQAELSR